MSASVGSAARIAARTSPSVVVAHEPNEPFAVSTVRYTPGGPSGPGTSVCTAFVVPPVADAVTPAAPAWPPTSAPPSAAPVAPPPPAAPPLEAGGAEPMHPASAAAPNANTKRSTNLGRTKANDIEQYDLPS